MAPIEEQPAVLTARRTELTASTNATNGEGEKEFVQHVSIRDRLQHMTWAWYTLTMSTGGIALLLHRQPHQFNGLVVLGTIVFILNLVLFSGITLCILWRFIEVPSALRRSLQHPTESLFFGCFWLSLAVILIGIQAYGVPHCSYWLVVVVRILFWIYTACTFLGAVLQYTYLFTSPTITLQSFTPAWILPIFPVMLSGTIAGSIAPSQPADQAIAIIISGTTFQGLGFVVSILMYSEYVGRLLIGGLPEPNVRPGMFIAVGPPSFMAVSLIGMASAALEKFPTHYVSGVTAIPTADVLMVVATFSAIFLWSLAFWFLCVSLVSVAICVPHISFHLAWWAFAFPNTGFVLAMVSIGEALQSASILWVASVLSVLQVAVWLFVAVCNIRAVWLGQILWPGKDEDKDE